MTDKQHSTTKAPSNMTPKDEKQQASSASYKQQEQKKPLASKTTPASKSPKGTKRATLAVILSLVLAAGVGGISYYQNQKNQEITHSLQTQISSLKEELSHQLNSQQKDILTSVDEAKNIAQKASVQTKQEQESIKSLQNAIADLKGRSPNDWLLAEADYLLKIAGRKLFLEHDVVSATELVESADQRIASLNDPSLISLRQAMTEDITTLKSLPLVDQEGLIVKLMALQNQVEKLPLSNTIIPKSLTEKEDADVSSDVYDWQDNILASLKSFSDRFITIRVREGDIKPLLTPKQHFYLQENLRAKLETAIQGAEKENNDIYKQALDMASQWSHKFLDQNSASVIEFQQQIEELAKQNVQVNYPTELISQKPLTDIISERLRRSIATVGEESSL